MIQPAVVGWKARGVDIRDACRSIFIPYRSVIAATAIRDNDSIPFHELSCVPRIGFVKFYTVVSENNVDVYYNIGKILYKGIYLKIMCLFF